MSHQSYEEYIRSILGYPSQNFNSLYEYTGNYEMENSIGYDMNYSNQYRQSEDLEECYPEIYKVVYPMVIKACQNNFQPVTRNLVENMTDEIYMAIEGNEQVQININLNNGIQNNRGVQSRGTDREVQTKVGIKTSEKSSELQQKRETRQINRGLRDIIKILILRELLGRPGFPGHRPPRPPMRPPFPGGPGGGRPPFTGGGPGRPPIMPRTDLYEM